MTELAPQEKSYHYAVIRRAIELIDASALPLPLDALAAEMNMSPHHFQKVFSQWVGVSPKRYQQYLALGHAKSMLDTRHTLAEVADGVGLSGTGRLHDLFIRWEAMTPGEYAAAAADLPISYGWFETPFGDTLAMATPRGLCGMAFSGDMGRAAALEDMKSRWPAAKFNEAPDEVAPYVCAALRGGETRLHMIGAPFQIKVWEALMSIPSGAVTTYSDLAQAVGNPKAVRAVGTAVGRNPVSWLIPCHRALRKSGALGGYHWGLPVKRALLAYETLQAEARGSD